MFRLVLCLTISYLSWILKTMNRFEMAEDPMVRVRSVSQSKNLGVEEMRHDGIADLHGEHCSVVPRLRKRNPATSESNRLHFRDVGIVVTRFEQVNSPGVLASGGAIGGGS